MEAINKSLKKTIGHFLPIDLVGMQDKSPAKGITRHQRKQSGYFALINSVGEKKTYYSIQLLLLVIFKIYIRQAKS